MAMDVKRYVWTDEELQALQNKGLHLRCPMVVRDASERDYVAKSLPNDSNELDVFRTLLTLRSPRNHVIPCELLPCAKSTVALMPWLEAVIVPQIPLFHGTVTLVDILSQLIEGLQFMHDHRIVYGDMASMNMVTWEGWCAKEFYSCPIVRGRIYFIDFGSSRCFPKGPGEGLRIMDWSTFRGRLIPPEGKDEVDPYAYDVYSLGETMYQFCQTDGATGCPNLSSSISVGFEDELAV
ncbi:hypothetical protein OBBRIDRAFT_804669 [Obba rivulosa]|uniref:Protein kinase domain-containing protein n=1 Tax=Obba rivulosa TaxID=1052685 RepID=A0A8E2DND1_9APHY|nr:hypothetical protein OBBRIDRAFT_804669 [Obba rivulosa]